MNRRTIAILTVALTACRTDTAATEADAPATELERPALSFTDWVDATELFIELPALVRGEASPCAAHVTALGDFSALAEGEVTVVLRGAAGDVRFSANAPTQPGIFRPIVVPANIGRHRVIVEIRAPGIVSDHDLGDVEVFADDASAHAGTPDEPDVAGRIVFLKEQQWLIEFGTQSVAERTVRPSLRTTGVLRPRTDADVEVTAPVAGRLARSGSSFPKSGDRVVIDDVLAVLAPRLEAADLASLELAVKSSKLEVGFAERERERLETLRREGAIPERRVVDATHVEEEARAALGTAERRLGQFRRVQRTTGRGEGSLQLRAPLSGTVGSVDVGPGAFVEAGAAIVRVTDTKQIWLEARVPASEVERVGMLSDN